MALEDCFDKANNVISSSCSIDSVGEGILLAGIFAFIVTTFLALYVYHALAWRRIATKLNHPKPWLAWIPFASSGMRLQLGGFSWKWVFLVLIPFLGWVPLIVLLLIAHWKIFEKRSYPGWFSLSVVIPEVGNMLYLVALGFVAWKDKKENKSSSPLPKKHSSKRAASKKSRTRSKSKKK